MWTKLWTGEMMYKLKNKQLIHLTKGKYHDGGSPYQTSQIKVDKDCRRLFVQLVTFDIIDFLQRCTKSVRKYHFTGFTVFIK